MDAFTTSPSGITSTFTGDNAVERRSAEVPAMWRPWDATCVQREAQKMCSNNNNNNTRSGELSEAKHPVTHPVKLYWPKTKCFDYLYQDAEMLLRNYPVQATICLYEEDHESSGDEDSDDDDEEEEEEEEDSEKEMMN